MAKIIKSIQINASQLAGIVEACITSGTNLYIEGPAGVGKSEIVEQVCRKMAVPLFKHRLADCEPSDLRGLPIVSGHDTDGNPTMKFSRPDDIPPATGRSCWFLDEINRATRAVMNSVMQASDSNKRVGSHKLSRDTVIIAAGNPSSNNGYDVGELDLALNNRFLHVVINYDTNALIDYATAQEWNTQVVDFMKVNKANLFTGEVEPGQRFCTPRSLERLSNLMTVLGTVDRTQSLAMIQGCIGAGLGQEFFSFIYEVQPIKFAELMTKKGKDRLKKLSQEAGYRADLISLTIDDIVENLKDKKQEDITDEEASSVEFLLKTIQAEQSASAIATLAAKCRCVLLHDKIAKSTTLRDRLQRVA